MKTTKLSPIEVETKKREYHTKLFTDMHVRKEEHIPKVGDEYQAEIPPMIISSEKEQRTCRNNYKYPLVSTYTSWSNFEVDIFLLGLYIFGKDFVQAKKFMGNIRTMAEVLFFYYTKFKKSEKYSRWADGWWKDWWKVWSKIKEKERRVIGMDLFKGTRMKQLLANLLPHVSKDLQVTLLEISMSFEGQRLMMSDDNDKQKLLLQNYMSTLKNIVGLPLLVDAVGIGKANRDLTMVESINVCLFTPPNGKKFSSLEPSEIIRFLTGSFRLNDAWCCDIFKEAVWPLLLERGWTSNKPVNEGYADDDDLVFLVPGIRKFSRRAVKGKDYFDSIDDVLNLVVSEPQLIELHDDKDEELATQIVVPAIKRRKLTARTEEEGPSRIISPAGDKTEMKYNASSANAFAEGRSQKEKGLEDEMSKYISAFDAPLGTEIKISAICIDLTHVMLESETADDVKGVEQPLTPINPRRQSTRIRAPSTKALECIQNEEWDLPKSSSSWKDGKDKERKPLRTITEYSLRNRK